MNKNRTPSLTNRQLSAQFQSPKEGCGSILIRPNYKVYYFQQDNHEILLYLNVSRSLYLTINFVNQPYQYTALLFGHLDSMSFLISLHKSPTSFGLLRIPPPATRWLWAESAGDLNSLSFLTFLISSSSHSLSCFRIRRFLRQK